MHIETEVSVFYLRWRPLRSPVIFSTVFRLEVPVHGGGPDCPAAGLGPVPRVRARYKEWIYAVHIVKFHFVQTMGNFSVFIQQQFFHLELI